MRSGHQALQGLPLEEAAVRFAPPRLKRQINRSIAPAPDQPTAERPHTQGDFPRQIRELSRDLMKSLEPIQAQAEARDAAREYLLELLKSGTHVAHGFPAHLPVAHQRSEVEPFLFEMRFADWNRSTFEGRGRIYEGVLISKQVASPPNLPTNSAAEAAPQNEVSTAKGPVGRPNVRNLVAELALVIFDSENAPEWKWCTELIPYIRALGMEKYPQHFDQNRPGKEVFRYGINKALENRPAIKAAHKL
jgi:hypothetical protein